MGLGAGSQGREEKAIERNKDKGAKLWIERNKDREEMGTDER